MNLPFGSMLFRLFLAVLFGGLVGYERERHGRPAGLRTHILVCLGSALIMIVSAYGFLDESFYPLADPSRIASQVVSGIGFLGAGTIMRQGVNIRGLTTAASLWVVAAIGLSVGLGFYKEALVTTVLVLTSLYVLAAVEKLIVPSRNVVDMDIVVIDEPGIIGKIGGILGEKGINITKINLSESEYQETYNADIIAIELMLKLPPNLKIDELLGTLMEQDKVLEINWRGDNAYLRRRKPVC
ncbi:MAG TPA: MgtC/SapB family protein [Firmicutes bacterium]|nr:MgtC/SapB family protein [Bacillota bacterium]